MKTNIVNFRGRAISVMSPVKVYRNLRAAEDALLKYYGDLDNPPA